MTRTRTSLPAAVAVKSPDEQAAARLPLFGPGLVIRIPLNPPGLYLAYLKAHHLDVLKPQLPAHERIQQQVVYVKQLRTPSPRASIRWRCLACPEQPELFQPAMIVHMQTVHSIDTADATGTKTLTMKLDAEGVYQSAWEYVINGLLFLKYEPEETAEAK